jgi:hypothetical protein
LIRERKENAVTIVRVGPTKKYSEGWEGAFGKKSGSRAVVKASTRAVATKMKKKGVGKKSKR